MQFFFLQPVTAKVVAAGKCCGKDPRETVAIANQIQTVVYRHGNCQEDLTNDDKGNNGSDHWHHGSSGCTKCTGPHLVEAQEDIVRTHDLDQSGTGCNHCRITGEQAYCSISEAVDNNTACYNNGNGHD